MASEDSVKHFLEWSLSLLAFVIHRIGNLDDSREPLLCSMRPRFEETYSLSETGVIFLPCGIHHIPLKERNDLFRDRASRRDGINQHVGISLLGKDTTCLEDLARELKQ